ncbi:MAG: RelA/SpoT family protein [Rikenellaceae bacterium]
MNKIKDFLVSVRSNFSSHSYDSVKEALKIAIKCSEDRKRYNGDPFYYHEVGVAKIVIDELGMGSVSVVCSLLHEAVRSKNITLEEVTKKFSSEHAEILMGMNNISTVKTKTSQSQLENFKELIVSYSTNPRIILIKLADRLEVMRSLAEFPEAKRAKKSWETLHLYSQLAHKLGLYKIKSEMEDISLMYLEPVSYSHIKENLEKTAGERENFIEFFTAPVIRELDKANYKYSIKGRTKSIYSIWRKMKKQRISFSEVYDVFAIRIVIDCPKESEKAQCWHSFSIVTDFYKPNTERMRDWISIPKSNGYESLHTTVVTNEGKWVEVQIRTKRMDEVAEMGIAAHWKYKGVSGGEASSEQWLSRLREMMESVEIEDDKIKFETDKLVGGTKEVFVFTPDGDLRKLRKGATVLDFAYDIHSGLGSKCVGGRINHKNVPIKEVLKNGDLVEILTVKNQKPKADWLTFAVTSKARTRIKAFLREEETKMANLGREELERKVKNWKLPLDIETSGNVLMKYFKQKSILEIYGLIVDEKISMTEVKDVLTKHVNGELALKVTEERNDKKEKEVTRREENASDLLVIDGSLKGIEYKLSKCCNPIFGDDIFGFVTVLGGITIHRTDCVNGVSLHERFPYRVIKAAWGKEGVSRSFSSKVVIESDDVLGLELAIRDVLKNLKITLRGLNMNYEKDSVKITVTTEVSSIESLDSIIHKVLRIKGVRKAYRLGK